MCLAELLFAFQKVSKENLKAKSGALNVYYRGFSVSMKALDLV